MVTRELILRTLGSPEDLDRIEYRLLVALGFTIPWSIAASQTILAIAFVVALRHSWLEGGPRLRSPLTLPILAFLATATLAAVVGLDPSQSLWGLRTYLQVVLIFMVHRHVRTEERMRAMGLAFLAGMTLTSTHTLWNAITPWDLPERFPGGMTESGQLIFAIGIVLGLVLYRGAAPVALAAWLAIFSGALLANLKRGAWLGMLATLVAFGLLRSRRLFAYGAVAVATVFVLVAPLRERVSSTAHDFFLPGSRYDIWVATLDVVDRFPMGVGRKNGTILRDYPNVPSRHKHAHSNGLQLALENGYLGLAAFLWWMVAFGRLAWRNWGRELAETPIERGLVLATFTTFIGFHVAGLVEYNFGDTEVLQILFVLMGMGLVFHDRART